MQGIKERALRILKGLALLAVLAAFGFTLFVILATIASSIWTGYALPSVVVVITALVVWVPVALWARRRLRQYRDHGPAESAEAEHSRIRLRH